MIVNASRHAVCFILYILSEYIVVAFFTIKTVFLSNMQLGTIKSFKHVLFYKWR